ncbi:MAG: TfoX/Sxy family protein [Bacilli bacterium]
MASHLDFVLYICDQIESVGKISYKRMMGEYLIYVNGVYCLAVADNQVFIKPFKEVLPLLEEVLYAPMYRGAKDSLLITNVDDALYLSLITKTVYDIVKNL